MGQYYTPFKISLQIIRNIEMYLKHIHSRDKSVEIKNLTFLKLPWNLLFYCKLQWRSKWKYPSSSTITSTYLVRVPCWSRQGMSYLALIRTFPDHIQVHFGELKCTESWYEKVSGLFAFELNWPIFGRNLTPLQQTAYLLSLMRCVSCRLMSKRGCNGEKRREGGGGGGLFNHFNERVLICNIIILIINKKMSVCLWFRFAGNFETTLSGEAKQLVLY